MWISFAVMLVGIAGICIVNADYYATLRRMPEWEIRDRFDVFLRGKDWGEIYSLSMGLAIIGAISTITLASLN